MKESSQFLRFLKYFEYIVNIFIFRIKETKKILEKIKIIMLPKDS